MAAAAMAGSDGVGSFYRPPLDRGQIQSQMQVQMQMQQGNGYGQLGSNEASSSSNSNSNGGSNAVRGGLVGHAARPSMGERTVTSSTVTGLSNIESPMASGSIANRIAHAQYGLYQQSLNLQKQLRRVAGFQQAYLEPANNPNIDTSDVSSTSLPSPLSPTGPAPPSAVDVVLECLRLGAPLCALFNHLGNGKPLEVPETSISNYKACQRSAAHFIMACNTRLGWPYDEMFTTTELLSQSTNGTVKVRFLYFIVLTASYIFTNPQLNVLQVIHTVSKFLNLLEERGLLLPEKEEDDQSSAFTSLDTRGKVAKEILDSERKYVQDLEVLQVSYFPWSSRPQRNLACRTLRPFFHRLP